MRLTIMPHTPEARGTPTNHQARKPRLRMTLARPVPSVTYCLLANMKPSWKR